ncbi:hypothetical protein J4430_03330 [Candidatus Woesearchaeota archaeon]|nr:hypothetical protein [Candidatus Woesearchaeota archaeon]
MKFDFLDKHYRPLLLIPLVLLGISFIIIGLTFSSIGDILYKDVSLKGGLSATVVTQTSPTEISSILKEAFPDTSFTIRSISSFGSSDQEAVIIESGDIAVDQLRLALESFLKIKFSEDEFSVSETGSSLGSSFYRQMLNAILFAFGFMAIVVLITFRSIVPSFVIIFSAFADIVITISILDLFAFPVSAAGISALLLLMGYSIDTDVLLTTRLLRRHDGSVFSRVVSSMKTGLTMTFTSMVAMVVGLIFATSPVLHEMFLIILIGLCVDIFVTYLFNGGILRLYLERRVS